MGCDRPHDLVYVQSGNARCAVGDMAEAMSDSFTGNDVLARAHDILKAGPLKDSPDGRWCPWCACAKAKGQLDSEHGITLIDCITGGGDTPLIEARWALGRWNHIDTHALDQAAALDILWSALDRVEQ